jgi:hypothetical protein
VKHAGTRAASRTPRASRLHQRVGRRRTNLDLQFGDCHRTASRLSCKDSPGCHLGRTNWRGPPPEPSRCFTLVASGPQARPSARRFLLSISFHGVAVAGAIALSRQPSTATAAPQTQPALVFVAPQPRQRSLPAASDRSGGQAAPTPSWEPHLQIPDLIPPVLPSTLPRVADLLGGAFLRSGSSLALPGSPVSGIPPMGDVKPWPAESVDDPVEVIEQPPMRYPPALAQAGITGRVELE